LASAVFNEKRVRNFLLAAGILLACLGSFFRLFDLYELQTYDWRFKLRGPRPVSGRIVHIDIWNDTLNALGAWPFERIYHAKLIDALHSAGAKAVVFDVIFSEPRQGDEEVAESAAAAGNVYFGEAFGAFRSQKSSFVADRLIDPLIEPYRQAAKGVGFLDAKTDPDGKVRRALPKITFEGKEHPQLAFLVAKDISGSVENVPLDSEGCFLINFAGPWEKSFKHYSYLDILSSYSSIQKGEKPLLDLKELKDKVCFVGLASMGAHDVRATPLEAATPMVGSHANILNGILMHDTLRRLDRVWNLLILVVFGGWLAWVSSRSKPLWSLVYTLLTASFFVGSACLLFALGGIWIDLFYPLLVFGLIYLTTTLTRAIFEKRKRELLENELKIASRIQQSFLPAALPEEKGMDLAVFMKPAKAVGGDLYAFLPFGEGKLGVMVGDVSGKGTPAALFMAKAVSEFKFSAKDKTDPARTLEALNDSVASESTGGLFVTISYAIFDLDAKKMYLSNGGHLPVVSVSAGSERQLSSDGGMPIGVLPGVSFSSTETPLRSGDIFAFYSDGVPEARNRKKEEFGIEALTKILRESASLSAKEILARAVNSLERFMGKAEQHDDITLIIVKIGESHDG